MEVITNTHNFVEKKTKGKANLTEVSESDNYNIKAAMIHVIGSFIL